MLPNSPIPLLSRLQIMKYGQIALALHNFVFRFANTLFQRATVFREQFHQFFAFSLGSANLNRHCFELRITILEVVFGSVLESFPKIVSPNEYRGTEQE